MEIVWTSYLHEGLVVEEGDVRSAADGGVELREELVLRRLAEVDLVGGEGEIVASSCEIVARWRTSMWSKLLEVSGPSKLWTIDAKTEPLRVSWMASSQSCTRAEWWGTYLLARTNGGEMHAHRELHARREVRHAQGWNTCKHTWGPVPVLGGRDEEAVG